MIGSPQKWPRLAVAISVYNRWEELAGLLELLRINWRSGPDLYVTVTSTALESEVPSWLDPSLAGFWQFGSKYELPPQSGRSNFLRRHMPVWPRRPAPDPFTAALRARTVDSIQRGGRHCLQSSAAYTMHLHAAAWPLKEEKIYDILNHMHQHGYVVAGRGYGKRHVDDKRPAGDIDDNFFIIENAFARRTAFWEFDPALDAGYISNEGRLARRVYELCADSEVYLFDDFSRPEEYLFPQEANPRRVQPFNYHKPLGLLRSHDLTKQAELCGQMGLKGPTIERIIKKYSVQS